MVNTWIRSLGFKDPVAVVNSYFGATEGLPIWINDVRCTGNETSILDCPNDGIGNIPFYCDRFDHAGVQCPGPGIHVGLTTWKLAALICCNLPFIDNIDILYPFGILEGDSVVPEVDDGSTSAIQLTTGFRFFGRNESDLYVCTVVQKTMNKYTSRNHRLCSLYYLHNFRKIQASVYNSVSINVNKPDQC